MALRGSRHYLLMLIQSAWANGPVVITPFFHSSLKGWTSVVWRCRQITGLAQIAECLTVLKQAFCSLPACWLVSPSSTLLATLNTLFFSLCMRPSEMAGSGWLSFACHINLAPLLARKPRWAALTNGPFIKHKAPSSSVSLLAPVHFSLSSQWPFLTFTSPFKINNRLQSRGAAYLIQMSLHENRTLEEMFELN